MVELECQAHAPEPSREFSLTAQSITNWVGHGAIDSGKPLPSQRGLSHG